MTDMESLKYFLGLEISSTVNGLFVHQSKYTKDVLHRFGMTSAKSCSTPLALVSSTDSRILCSTDDSRNYRALTGALHYLTFSRLDIAFAISKPFQFMHSPHEAHLVAAKRHGILFRKSTSDPLRLLAYWDSDWAGDSLDWRSTSRYVVF
ncbi:uncharacterized protein LOC111024167 [Momordica charantia]|uniref:Uncharacterized protein LOC111024167 n=1 Tax=Momordica charantia TaxID=3673 RepID=A0A6J1DT77_MOMCH|nr:uncharacterized protein LOC111024167 [Momordica charantia]